MIKPPVQIFSKQALEYRGPGERLLHIIELEQKRIVQGSARESLFKGSRFNVDSQGVVMILLANKGIIRDTGEKIFFSKDKGAKEAAKIYAGVKFGSKIQVRRNVVEKFQDGPSDIASGVCLYLVGSRHPNQQRDRKSVV